MNEINPIKVQTNTEAMGMILGWAGGALGFIGLLIFIYGCLGYYLSSGDFEKKKKALSSFYMGLMMFLVSIAVSFFGFFILYM